MLRFPPWKVATILAIVLYGLYLALPNVFAEADRANLPVFMSKQGVNLGLDLRGGSYLLLEVDAAEVKRERLEETSRDMQKALLEAPRIPFTGRAVVDGAARVRITDETRVDEAEARIRKLFQPAVGALGATPADFVVDVTDGTLFVRLTETAEEEMKRDAVQRTIEVVRRRIDELGTREPNIQRQGTDRIIVEVPGEGDPARLKAILSQTARMTFSLVDETADISAWQAGRGRPGWRMLPVEGREEFEPFLVVESTPLITGDQLTGARQAFDQSGQPVVAFTLNQRGARAFGEASTQNVGRRFAIVLDDKIISAPSIREPILGGSGQISGSFTAETANDLAVVLRAGALPARITVVEERTVGAGLGADSIRSGAIASIIGLAVVAVFIMLAYGVLGIFAVLSLLTNILLILGVLSGLQSTLTLPGIAGIILTIGMAVDANVLVFERIREELREGRSPMSAIEIGYSRALSTIMDANITTLLAAAVLFQLGSGPVKGFAVTLGIGVITSVFTAFMVTRMFTVWWLRLARPKKIVL
jgi:preprotein translocase subunit SecD